MSDDPKSPRDWLLARHAASTPRLDELRRAALPPSPSLTWREFFRELFRPHRLAWRTLAAAWVLLLVFHLVMGRRAPVAADSATPPPPEAVIAWFRQLQSHEALAHLDR